MRIAFVHPSAPGAEGTGATHTATLLVRALSNHGHDVTVFCRGSPETPPADDLVVEPLDTAGFPYHTASSVNRALEARARDGEFHEFDIVHSYLPSTVPALGEIGATVPVGTVVTLNAYGGVCPKNDLRYMDRERCHDRGALRCAACSLATSPGNEEYGTVYRSISRLGNLRLVSDGLRRLEGIDAFHPVAEHVAETYASFGFPADRLSVAPTPVDERFLVTHRDAFEPPYRLLYVGHLKRHKGVDRLLPTLDRVREAGIDARLTVVGDGGRRSLLEQQAADRELEAVTRFTGHLPNADLPEVYTSHDLFVYPGRWEEPLARVFIESLATGTPVVATDVGSARSILGEAGIVTDSSMAGLADGVVTAITDGALERMSAAGHERIDRYRPAAVVRGLERLYRRALER